MNSRITWIIVLSLLAGGNLTLGLFQGDPFNFFAATLCLATAMLNAYMLKQTIKNDYAEVSSL